MLLLKFQTQTTCFASRITFLGEIFSRPKAVTAVKFDLDEPLNIYGTKFARVPDGIGLKQFPLILKKRQVSRYVTLVSQDLNS